jgi:hypothetical protein
MVTILLIVLLSVGKKKKKERSYKKDKHYKKKTYGEAHIGKEWDSNDESSNSDSDGVATIAIKVRNQVVNNLV